MTAANNTRPLPWHDTARCTASDREYAGVAAERGVCGGPMVPMEGTREARRIKCAACGCWRHGAKEEVARVLASHRAWEAHETGKYHTDRACARCNALLTLDRERLCGPCVDEDNAERQAVLL